MLLYDVTPLALPDIEKPNQDWFNKLQSALNGEDYYFACSEYTKRDFLRFYPVIDAQKFDVALLAAADNFYFCTDKKKTNEVRDKYGLPKDKRYVFSLCTLQPRKNLVFAIKCFINFISKNNIDDLVFVLGGGHWEQFIGILDQEIDNLGEYRDKIIKAGYIDDDDLAPLYSDAIMTVYMSLYEGFGLPVLEAMQCGCPVICSDATSIPEVIGDAGITVDPRNEAAMISAYEKMYGDAKLRQSCREKGLERAKQFSWDKCADVIIGGMSAASKAEPELIPTKPVQKKKRKTVPYGTVVSHKGPFKKVWTEPLTRLYFWGIPFAKKVKEPNSKTIRAFGIPIAKQTCDNYTISTYFFGIRVKKRINYAYIDQCVNKYVSQIEYATIEFERKVEYSISLLSEQMASVQMSNDHDFTFPKKKAENGEPIKSELQLESMELLDAVRDGKLSIESEIKEINQWLKNSGY